MKSITKVIMLIVLGLIGCIDPIHAKKPKHSVKPKKQHKSQTTTKHNQQIIQALILRYNLFKNQRINDYKLTLCTDLNVLEFFHIIKHDMGITDTIELYNTTDSTIYGLHIPILSKDFDKQNNVETMGIVLNLERISNDPIKLIHIIAHELGHYLQYKHAPNRYPTKSNDIYWYHNANEIEKTEDAIKKETDADAASAEYQCCAVCLEHIQKTHGHAKESDEHKKGYFSKDDYQPYIDQAKKHGWLCPAHEHLAKQSYLYQLKYILKHYDPYPAKDFLPKRDRSNYPPLKLP